MVTNGEGGGSIAGMFNETHPPVIYLKHRYYLVKIKIGEEVTGWSSKRHHERHRLEV